ncbi:helix-turn-helix transcriptional regulator [Nocardia sp. NPDC050793]|uniref:helix-turn-helix domain-containing protein n=1 Tax=Nocardia sp. NPDC050793 TaxID=3155159 RepID=UPI0033E42781
MRPNSRDLDPRDTAEALFGAELRARRVAAGLSLRQLASLVLISHALLARIETAQRRPQPDVVDRLDAVLRANGELKRWAEPLTDFARPPYRIELDPDSAEIAVRKLITKVRTADHTMAAGHLDDVIVYAHGAQQIVSRVDASQRVSLHRAIAEAHQLTGWMQFDRGSVAAAERSFTAARRAAEQANALDLLAFVGGPNAGFVSTWAGDPDRGAELCYASLGWARRSQNHRLTAFVTTMAARAHARMGETELCLQMLGEAETALSRHRPDEPDPVWLEVFDDAALAGHRGSCLLDLGQFRAAVDALREQESSSPAAFVRNRTIWLLEQAEAQLRMGDQEAAAATVEQAMNGVESGLITPRVARLFRSIDLKLRACEDAAIAEIRDRLELFIAASL